jgi:hypothetical protein
MRHGSREQFIGAALAILVTMIIIIEFLVDSKINTAPPPQVVEVSFIPRIAPMPRSSLSKRSIRPSATLPPKRSNGNSRSWKKSSECKRRRALHG